MVEQLSNLRAELNVDALGKWDVLQQRHGNYLTARANDIGLRRLAKAPDVVARISERVWSDPLPARLPHVR